MKGTTHIAAGIVAGMLLTKSMPAENPLIILTGTIVGSLLPDIDICASKLGRRAKAVSSTIQTLVGHRTVFHGPLLYLIAGLMLYHAYPGLWLWILTASTGIALHLFLDAANPAGIPVFWPLPTTYSYASISSGGVLDRLLAVGLYAIIIYSFFTRTILF